MAAEKPRVGSLTIVGKGHQADLDELKSNMSQSNDEVDETAVIIDQLYGVKVPKMSSLNTTYSEMEGASPDALADTVVKNMLQVRSDHSCSIFNGPCWYIGRPLWFVLI